MNFKLQSDETILHESRPEARILAIWLFTKCLGGVFIGGIIAGVAVSVLCSFLSIQKGSDALIGLGLFIILSVVLLILMLSFVYCICLRRTYKYTITNRRCVFSGGILRCTIHSVPFHKITDVEMSQNIVERILGISSLGIFTPGTGSMGTCGSSGRRPEISYTGLADCETPAETIHEMLSQFKATGQ